MDHPVRAEPGRARLLLLLADGLTASRVLVALALVAGDPSARIAVLLVAWAWASDALDGSLARSAGGQGRLAALDHPVDAAVTVALVWYLAAVGFLPPAARLAAVALVALWVVTRVFMFQMLLAAGAYGSFVLWAVRAGVDGRWLLLLVVVVIAVGERRRLVTELLPANRRPTGLGEKPSFVRSSRPSDSKSSRPTGYTYSRTPPFAVGGWRPGTASCSIVSDQAAASLSRPRIFRAPSSR